VSTTIERLLALQEHDRRLARLRRESQDVPARKAQIEASIQSERDAMAAAEERLKHEQSEAKQIDLEVEAERTRITKLRTQQFEVKSNHDYKTLEHEIKTAEEKIRKLEDGELVIMEKMEATRAFLADRENELKQGENHVKSEISSLEERMTQAAEQIAHMESVRPSLTESIDAQWLSRYERTFSHRGDFAVVAVENGSCGGCHMKVPPHVAHDARKELEMVTCPYCGRLLCAQP